MIRRYDLRRSDNFPLTGKKAYTCSGNGFITITTGFPVTSAIITWASIPIFYPATEYSSSSEMYSESSSSSSGMHSESSSSSSGMYSESSSSSSDNYSESSSDNYSESSSTSSEEYSESSSSSSNNYSESSSSRDSSSSSSFDSSSSTSSEQDSSSSSSEMHSSDSSLSLSSESSLTSNEYYGPFDFPRLYVYDLLETGFVVRYENVPEEMGFVEFSYFVL